MPHIGERGLALKTRINQNSCEYFWRPQFQYASTTAQNTEWLETKHLPGMAETALVLRQAPAPPLPSRALTGNADVGFAALGGARGAPRHALAPVILRPEELLHLLPRDLDAHLPHNQTCQEVRNTGHCWPYWWTENECRCRNLLAKLLGDLTFIYKYLLSNTDCHKDARGKKLPLYLPNEICGWVKN